MAGPTSLGGDHVALRVLATLLRSRPQTLQELRELRSLPTDDLDAVLERLVRSGFIELADDRISYHAPDRAIEAQVSALADLVTVLPELTREWRRGADTAAAIDGQASPLCTPTSTSVPLSKPSIAPFREKGHYKGSVRLGESIGTLGILPEALNLDAFPSAGGAFTTACLWYAVPGSADIAGHNRDRRTRPRQLRTSSS